MQADEEFLSTLPRRERRERDRTILQRDHFYPRSHVGNDFIALSPTCAGLVFLSTFPRRERQNLPRCFTHLIYFYPRSHVGNDSKSWEERREEVDFYPRSHVGNDKFAFQNRVVLILFLSTFPRRERLFFACPVIDEITISIHVPT